MHQVPSAMDVAVVCGDFPGKLPDELFEQFASAEKLMAWWAKEAVMDARVGGKYRLSWPQQGWHLFGKILSFEPGKHLAWTWKWEHEDETFPPQRVDF